MTTPDLPYDPVCKEAMAEIVAILRKHDLGASVHLVSPSHSEFLVEFPTWSAAQLEGEQGVRIRTTHLPDQEAKKRMAELTAHLVFQLRDLAAQDLHVFEQLIAVLKKHWEIEHVPFYRAAPHRKQ